MDTKSLKKEFLSMVSSAIAKGPAFSCSAEDYPSVFSLAKRNNVQNIMYNVCANDEHLPDGIKERLIRNLKLEIFRDQSQMQEIEKIRSEFNKADIDFVLLKGSHLKKLYPSSEMRFMVDMDVLVKEKDMDKAKKIILSHGLKQKMNNGKDIVFISEPCLTIELHKDLFAEGFIFYDYYTDIWDKMSYLGEHEYTMTYNDIYIYVLAHMCEHYLDGSSCFRPCMDIYLMLKKYNLDREYIEEEFRKLGIETFAENIKNLCIYMFENGDGDETLDMMENYVVLGPPVKNALSAAHNAQKSESKLSRMIHTAFPGYRHMKKRYPVISKLPFLLPLMWLLRIFQFAFKKNSSSEFEKKKDRIVNTSKEDSEIMKEIFIKSGINHLGP